MLCITVSTHTMPGTTRLFCCILLVLNNNTVFADGGDELLDPTLCAYDLPWAFLLNLQWDWADVGLCYGFIHLLHTCTVHGFVPTRSLWSTGGDFVVLVVAAFILLVISCAVPLSINLKQSHLTPHSISCKKKSHIWFCLPNMLKRPNLFSERLTPSSPQLMIKLIISQDFVTRQREGGLKTAHE